MTHRVEGKNIFFRDGYYEWFDANISDGVVSINHLGDKELEFDKGSEEYSLVERLQREDKVRSDVDLYNTFFYADKE